MADTELVKQIKKEIWDKYKEPVLRFTLQEGEPGLTESKVGGTPYLPHELAWPLDTKGLPMTLLAQVDCAELKGLPDFPQSGLLQFFIGLDDFFGADFNDITKPGNFQVLYHEAVDPSVTAEEVRAKRPAIPEEIDTQYMSPLMAASRICFGTPEMQELTEGDVLFDKLFCEKWNALHPDNPVPSIWNLNGVWGDEDDEEEEEDHVHHQMGGYPYFTQFDPREQYKYPELDTLLFQLDSDMRREADGGDLVLWGDCGVANFFINREDLRRRDFSHIGYNWDCC